MSSWDESRLRKEASWQAFKEGKSLFESDRVLDLKRNGEVVVAGFGVGKRRLRTVVRLGPQLEVECQCQSNRSSGEVCAHGVATVLAAMVGETVPGGVWDIGTEPDDRPLVPYRIQLPPGYERGLQAGRLGLRIEKMEEPASEADRSVSGWLHEHAPDAGFPLMLSLKGADAAEFLDAVADHPRVFGDEGERVEVLASAMSPVVVTNSEHRGDKVLLEVRTQVVPFRWGTTVGWIDGGQIGRAPVEPSSSIWCDEAIELIREGVLNLGLDAFLRDIDSWLNLLQPPYAGWLSNLRFESRPADLTIHIEGSLNALDLKLTGGQAERAILADDGRTVQTTDQDGYHRLLHHLTDLGFRVQGEGMSMRDHDQIVRFLADELPALERQATVIMGDRLSHVRKSLHVIRPHIEFGDGGSLSCELSFQTDGGKVVPRAKVLEMLRGGRASVKTASGAEVVVSRAVTDQMEPLLADLGVVRPEGRMQLSRAQHECLRRAVDPGTGLSLPTRVPGQVGEATLRDYQRRGADWILDRWSHFGGALLADEMGLGKTLQTIAGLAELKRAGDLGQVLVLVPTSLLCNWEIELQRFGPEMKVVRLHGPQRDDKRGDAEHCDVVLTSYGTFLRDLAFHLKRQYRIAVFDEASLLRNPDSELSRAAAKLAPERRLALTGTPVENRLRDLWSIFRVVAPGYLGAKDEFLQRYEDDSSGAARLRARISPFLLRRTKSEVAKDLPSRIEIDQWLDLGSESRALYREVAQAGLSQWEALEDAGNTGAASMHLLTTLLRLRQICLDSCLINPEETSVSSVKSEWLNGFLQERNSQNRKTLVFSQFSKFLRIQEKRLQDAGNQVFRLDGSTPNRGALVDRFQAHVGPAVFLISLKAGGYGLNLTAADAVVHMDPWWNPAAEAQASDRAHRIGQTRPVSIYRLLVRNSVEERVQRLQQAKRGLIARLNDGELPRGWEREDLVGLLTE